MFDVNGHQNAGATDYTRRCICVWEPTHRINMLATALHQTLAISDPFIQHPSRERFPVT